MTKDEKCDYVRNLRIFLKDNVTEQFYEVEGCVAPQVVKMNRGLCTEERIRILREIQKFDG
jgi:hypothetical protein